MRPFTINLKIASLVVAGIVLLVGAWWLSVNKLSDASSDTPSDVPSITPSNTELDFKQEADTISNTHRAILTGYRRLAGHSYEAAYHSADRLRKATLAFLAEPSKAGLDNLRQMWRLARIDYSQTEVFRFGNWIVDDWEGQVNAWPVDEGLLDYVSTSYQASSTNPLSRHNLVANANILVGGISIKADSLEWPQLKFIHGGSEHESNVLLGYHAIEFMLWGQDLNQTTSGAGQRPWTDYATGYASGSACTSGQKTAPIEHCQRRRQLLQTMVEHLYQKLGSMTLSWAGSGPASYGEYLVNGDPQDGLRRMLFGMIRLAGDELSGERMQVALISGAPEEEQDCFSDDTHQSIYYNAMGIKNIYYGQYRNERYSGGFNYQAEASVAQLAQQTDAALAAKIDQAFIDVEQSLLVIKQRGEAGETFDLLIRPDNTQGHQFLQQAITELQNLSQLLEQLGYAIGLQKLNPQAPLGSN